MKFFLLMAVLSSVNFGGYLKGFFYSGLHDAEIKRGGIRFQGRVEGRLKSGGLLGEFDFDEDLVNGAGPRVYPVEAYLDFYSKFLDIRFGKQFIFWGYSHWIIPTDTITPWDFLRMGPELEDYRVSVFGVRAWIYIKDLTIETVFLPFPEFNRLPLPENWKEVPVDKDLKHSEFGAKLSGSVKSLEYFLSFHYGFDRYPSFYPTSPTEGIVFHKRMRTGGLGLRGGIGKFILRGECAFSLTDDKGGDDPFVRNPFIHAVISPSFYPSEDSEITLLASRVHYIKEDALSQSYTTVLLRFSHRFSDAFKVEGNAVYEVERRSYFILGFVKISPFDEGALFIGAVLFGGEEGPFKEVSKEDTIFLELKYWF